MPWKHRGDLCCGDTGDQQNVMDLLDLKEKGNLLFLSTIFYLNKNNSQVNPVCGEMEPGST